MDYLKVLEGALIKEEYYMYTIIVEDRHSCIWNKRLILHECKKLDIKEIIIKSNCVYVNGYICIEEVQTGDD